MAKIDTAMVFAAGFGTRMSPLTVRRPKPMLEVDGRTMLDRILDSLCDAGITKAVVNTHYKADIIAEHLKERNDLQIKISFEPEILGTGGGIIKALPEFGGRPFLAVNSDVVFLDDVKKRENVFVQLMEHYMEDNMDALLLLCKKDVAFGYDGEGDFDFASSGEGKSVKAINRASDETEFPYVFTGAEIIHPKVFTGEKERFCSLFQDIIYPKYLKTDGSMERIYGLCYKGQWLHLGTPRALYASQQFF